MEEMLIGPYIKQKRLDRGWTQEYLCEGICAAATLSRIESNGRTPSNSVLKALLERLGLPAGQFFALLSEDDLAVDRLKKNIRNEKIRFRRATEPERSAIREQILHDLSTLEKLDEEDNRFVRQFSLGTRAGIGGPEGSYTPEKQLEMLMEAIRLTIPRFDLNTISRFQYSVEEVMLVNQISRVYANSGNRKKSIAILSQLLKYIERNNQTLDHYPRQFCLAASNCAIDLGWEKRYNRAITLAEKGRKVCVEYGEYQFLPAFIAVLAECYYFLGNLKKSTALYHQAYVLYQSFGDSSNLTNIQREMKERLGLEPPYSTW